METKNIVTVQDVPHGYKLLYTVAAAASALCIMFVKGFKESGWYLNYPVSFAFFSNIPGSALAAVAVGLLVASLACMYAYKLRITMLCSLLSLPLLLGGCAFYWFNGYSSRFWIFFILLMAMATCALGWLAVSTARPREIELSGAVSVEGLPDYVGVHEDIARNVILSVITLGVYYLIWIYRMQKKTRVITVGGTYVTGEFLMSVFVPFYLMSWIYHQCEALAAAGREIGVPVEDRSAVCLALTLVFPIGGLIFYQDVLNRFADGMAALRPQPAPPSAEELAAAIPAIADVEL